MEHFWRDLQNSFASLKQRGFRMALAILIIGTHFCLMHGSVIQVYSWRIVDFYSDGCERCCGKMGCSGQSRLELQTRSHGAHSPGGDEENRGHGADTGPAVLLSPSHRWESVQWYQCSPGSCSDALQTVSLWRHQEEMHVFAPEGSGRYFNKYYINYWLIVKMLIFMVEFQPFL